MFSRVAKSVVQTVNQHSHHVTKANFQIIPVRLSEGDALTSCGSMRVGVQVRSNENAQSQGFGPIIYNAQNSTSFRSQNSGKIYLHRHNVKKGNFSNNLPYSSKSYNCSSRSHNSKCHNSTLSTGSIITQHIISPCKNFSVNNSISKNPPCEMKSKCPPPCPPRPCPPKYPPLSSPPKCPPPPCPPPPCPPPPCPPKCPPPPSPPKCPPPPCRPKCPPLPYPPKYPPPPCPTKNPPFPCPPNCPSPPCPPKRTPPPCPPKSPPPPCPPKSPPPPCPPKSPPPPCPPKSPPPPCPPKSPPPPCPPKSPPPPCPPKSPPPPCPPKSPPPPCPPPPCPSKCSPPCPPKYRPPCPLKCVPSRSSGSSSNGLPPGTRSSVNRLPPPCPPCSSPCPPPCPPSMNCSHSSKKNTWPLIPCKKPRIAPNYPPEYPLDPLISAPRRTCSEPSTRSCASSQHKNQDTMKTKGLIAYLLNFGKKIKITDEGYWKKLTRKMSNYQGVVSIPRSSRPRFIIKRKICATIPSLNYSSKNNNSKCPSMNEICGGKKDDCSQPCKNNENSDDGNLCNVQTEIVKKQKSNHKQPTKCRSTSMLDTPPAVVPALEKMEYKSVVCPTYDSCPSYDKPVPEPKPTPLPPKLPKPPTLPVVLCPCAPPPKLPPGPCPCMDHLNEINILVPMLSNPCLKKSKSKYTYHRKVYFCPSNKCKPSGKKKAK